MRLSPPRHIHHWRSRLQVNAWKRDIHLATRTHPAYKREQAGTTQVSQRVLPLS